MAKRDAIVAKVVGDTDLIQLIQTLRPSIVNKALRAGVTQQSRKISKDAKRLASKRSGQLRKSIGMKVRTYKKTSTVLGVIGPRHGFKITAGVEIRPGQVAQKNINPVNYSHLVEYGTSTHSQPKLRIMHPGAKAKPFLAPSLAANQKSSESVLMDKTKEVLIREAAKQAAKVAQKTK